jgi:mRNA-degrading endonuclease RelE of RelBE toxin-antitoxin system
MSYSIQLSENFKKEAKRLVKKYPSFKTELANLFTLLEENPTLGTLLGKDIFKIRLAISSKNKANLVVQGF